jgi:hypothetical protein
VIPLLLDVLASYRLTRLITADTILDGPRDALVLRAYERAKFKEPPLSDRIGALIDKEGIDVFQPGGWTELAQVDPHAPKLTALAWCRWCCGFWCSALVVIARRRFPRQWAPIAEALALSAGAALIAGLED